LSDAVCAAGWRTDAHRAGPAASITAKKIS
jgi:hypothetical protein